MSSEFKQHICRSYIKVFSSELTYLQKKKNDEFDVSENYFDLSVVSDNSNLEILGYTLVMASHPSNSKRHSRYSHYLLTRMYIL